MDFKNIPKICIGECYICLETMYFEDYCKKKNKQDQMHQTCGVVSHQICRGCFLKLKKNECPMCKRRLVIIPPLVKNELEYQEMVHGFNDLQIIYYLLQQNVNQSSLIITFTDENQ